MPKRIINDLIFSQPEHGGEKPSLDKARQKVDIPLGGREKRGGDILRSILVILSGAGLFFALFFFLTAYFTSAEVFITSVRRDAKLDDLVTMVKDEALQGKIKFSLMKIDSVETSNIPATGSKSVRNFSKGKVTLYNAFSASSQKLVVGTRLTTPDGKTYKLDKAVTIPGAKGSGANLTPGSAVVSVTSALPGAVYNVSGAKFTIPGLKGTSKYSKIYGKSLSDITGGYVGDVKVVSSGDINKARATLSESIKQKLLRQAVRETPDGYLFFDGLYSLDLKDNAIDNTYLSSDGSPTVQYRLNGSLVAVIVEGRSLNDYILREELKSDIPAGVIIRGTDKLSFTVANKEKVDLQNITSLPVKVMGDVELIWDFDAFSLKNSLAGVGKSNYQNIFKSFPAVKKAVAKFNPSWAWSFPENTDKIRVIKDFEQKSLE